MKRPSKINALGAVQCRDTPNRGWFDNFPQEAHISLMTTLSLKLSDAEARRLRRSARAAGKTRSAYLRSLLKERIETTDDLLRTWETGEVAALRPRRRRASA